MRYTRLTVGPRVVAFKRKKTDAVFGGAGESSRSIGNNGSSALPHTHLSAAAYPASASPGIIDASSTPAASVASSHSVAGSTSRSVVRAHHPERRFLLIAAVNMVLYLVVLGMMFYLNISPPGSGLVAERNAQGLWVVTHLVPASDAYDAGVRLGDIIADRDGTELGLKDGLGNGSQTFSGAHKLTTEAGVSVPLGATNSALQRWIYALLGLIFIGVGGPVLVKAQVRTAASAFYAFCVLTALAFALSIGAFSNNGLVWALLYCTLVLWAGSFAFFFFKFPVRIGKTPRQHAFFVYLTVAIGALVFIAYLWAFINPANYDLVRPIWMLYLLGCVLAGLLSLGRSLVAERAPDVRQQMSLLLGGSAFAVAPIIFLSIVPSLIFDSSIVSGELAAVSLGIMPLAFAYAITQHQLLGMRSFLRRGMVYLIMGSSVLIVFSMSAAALNSVMAEGWQKNEWGLIGFGFFVFLLAFSFSRLQIRVEHFVDRYIYHDAYDYKETLLQFSAQLASQQQLQVLSDDLVENTCRLMNLACGALLLAIDPDQQDSALVTSPLRYPSSEKDTVYLELYAEYGEYADTMIDGLEGELSQLGINLQRRDNLASSAPFRAPYALNGQAANSRLNNAVVLDDAADDVSSLCEGSSVMRVRSLSDVVGQTDLLEIVKPEPDMDAIDESDHTSVRSFLGVPLYTRSHFVGVLCLAGKKTGERFSKDDISLINTLGSQAALAVYNAQLHEARERALLDTITALAHAIDAKDGYTSQHSENMTGRAVALAKRLGLAAQEVENVRLGATMHDVGKIGIPDAVLNKPGRLSPEEYEVIKNHAAIGARILQPVSALQGVVPIVLHHQERYDGKGYPTGIAGENIPLGSRIISVVDTYGAMTEDRIYRKAPGHEAAISELQRCAGTQFDPDVVEAFVLLLKEQPELAELEPSLTSLGL